MVRTIVVLPILLLVGCELIAPLIPANASSTDAPNEPTIVYQTPDSIIVWYEKSPFNHKHDAAQAMIEAHCGKRHSEMELEEQDDSFTMSGTCR